MNEKNKIIPLKGCPICGSAPTLRKDSLDRGNGHGYPGNYVYRYECTCCGNVKGGETNDIYDKAGELNAEQRARQSWNKSVNEINSFIYKKNRKKHPKQAGINIIDVMSLKEVVLHDKDYGDDYLVYDFNVGNLVLRVSQKDGEYLQKLGVKVNK